MNPDAAEVATTALLEGGAIMLGTSIVMVALFRKLGLGATLGYIVGGVIIGPHVLGLFRNPEQLASITELGIALLLFIVGLELNPSRLWRLRKDIFGLGLMQVVLCGLALAAFIHFGFSITVAASIALGLPLALSSTAQVLPMLRGDGLLNTPHGERAFSILLLQDLAIVPMITIVAAMSRTPPDPSEPVGWTLAAYTVGAVVALVVAGRVLLNPMFRLVGRLAERELFVVAGLFVVMAAAALMHALHLSVPLGAFVAGVVLAESPYRHELESDVEPFRSILLGLFFLTVGMMLNLPVIAQRPLAVVGIALAVILIKTLLITLIARMFKSTWRKAFRLGLLLSQAGEFGFVLFTQASAAGLILPEATSLFGAVVTLSMSTTPFLMKLTDRIKEAPQGAGGRPGPAEAEDTPVIVVGYGRFGQTVAQMLMAKRVEVTVVDTDAEMIDTAGSFGQKVYFGDGTRLDLLRQAGAEQARAILFCNDNAGGSLSKEALTAVLDAFPQARVMVRTYDRRHMIELDSLDLAYTQRELFESAVKMGRAALKEAGIESSEIDRVEREYRLRDCERLERQAQTGDLRAGLERSFGPDRPLDDAAPEPAA